MSKNETIEDIVRDIRNRNICVPRDAESSHPLAEDMLYLADRIEAAVKRIGEVRYQIQEPYKGEWTNLYSTIRAKRTAKFSAESCSKAAKNIGQNSQRRIVKVIQTEEVVWENR